MKKKKKPLMANISSIYFNLSSKLSLTFKRGALGKRGYACKKFPGLVSSFGWEGDKDAPIAYVDGSYLLRDRGNTLITFGLKNVQGKINWYNKEGWLPCFVSEYTASGFECAVESFADKVEIGGNDYVVAYTRLTLKNISAEEKTFPRVSGLLVALTTVPEFVKPGETAVVDFAIAADRFGNKYSYPENKLIKSAGGFDEHYEHMKKYWEDRMSPLAKIIAIPNPELINAYKAGYVYTMIIKDGFELRVGENGYDRVFDHDVLGIMASLLTVGDFKDFDEYSKTILKNVQYPDAGWKFSWPYALYLQKTGDTELIKERFEQIKKNTRKISEDRSDNGIMRRTNAIDSNGHWTIDNWSALFGLSTYKYICDYLGEVQESEWAQAEYESLLSAVNDKLKNTISKFDLSYIPISMDEPNELGQRSDPRDANWACMFLFGRWAWDGYLFGAPQSGLMIDLIDDTYEHGFERRKDITDTIYNFGGYPHGYFCSAYNAGYGSTALRGERYRESGIRAYEFMIDHAQSGPFGWWEGVDYPNESSPWSRVHAAGGGGSCQHMWGQSTATKVLWDSLIVQRADSVLLIGRGIPEEWTASGEKIVIEDYPLNNTKRIGYSLTSTDEEILLELTGEGAGSCEAELGLIGLKGKIVSCDCDFDNELGTVKIPQGVKSVSVKVKR